MSMHERCGAAVDRILNSCVEHKTLDNITAVIIGLNGFEKMAKNRLNYYVNLKISEAKFDWDLLDTEA